MSNILENAAYVVHETNYDDRLSYLFTAPFKWKYEKLYDSRSSAVT